MVNFVKSQSISDKLMSCYSYTKNGINLYTSIVAFIKNSISVMQLLL